MRAIRHRWGAAWKAKKEALRRRHFPALADRLANLATWDARRRLRLSGPLLVLVDNSVLGHSITHETAWVSTGTSLWGGVHPVETGYSARIPVHPVDSPAREYANIKYLTGIAHLARQEHLLLRTSAELKAEIHRQPVGRFRGYGYFDFNLLRGLVTESVDGTVGETFGPKAMGMPSAAERQRARLDQIDDELYRALAKVLGNKNSQDAWHIRTAEKHGMFCFLTMDFKLREAVARLADKEPFASLSTKVMTPVELGEHLGVVPMPPHFFTYTDADFFVRGDLAMPDGKRRPLSSYRK